MNKIKIDIPREYKNLIWKLDLEIQSRKEIITYIFTENLNISNEQFDRYQYDYENKLYEFNLLKAEIERQIVIPKTNGKKYKWDLNYKTSILTIEVFDDDE